MKGVATGQEVTKWTFTTNASKFESDTDRPWSVAFSGNRPTFSITYSSILLANKAIHGLTDPDWN